MKKLSFIVLILTVIILGVFNLKREPFFKIKHVHLKKEKTISYLSYPDIVRLASNSGISKGLYKRLNKQFTTPYIVNRKRNRDKSLPLFSKPYIRITHWNIERGFHINAIKQIFNNRHGYYYSYKNNIKDTQEENLKKELRAFINSDIISLNEVDIGMPRTNYKNTVAELAKAINYNYAFATEFIELSPLVYKSNLDPKHYLGLHGNAILSKYPIKHARIIRLPGCYNWYETELRRKSPLESARRISAKAVFKEYISNEVRRGGRCALIADIELPNKEIITIVSTHLEDRCYPAGRFKQTEYLLDNLKYIRNPLVLAGDFNTTTTDSAPTSLKKEFVKRLKDPNFVARQVVLAAIPGAPIASGLVATGLSKFFQFKDPAALSIPVLFPNQERKIFKYLKEFQFTDGEIFDTEGDSSRSSNGKKGLLANSNERQLKGFESTFKLEEPRLIAYLKLDWFFVKPKRGRFFPFNGQTLQLINHSYPGRISDHEPITVDISL